MEASLEDFKRRRALVFIISSLALILVAVNIAIVSTALPDIQRGFGADLNSTGWIITAYMLMSLTIMPLMGRISDEWGRKRVFIGCLAIFSIGSWLCAVSTNIYWLIAFRFLQAVGGGGLVPSVYGLVGDYYLEERARAIGMFASIYSLGSISGPAIGGLLLTTWSWRSVFWISLPIGVLTLIAACLILFKDRHTKRTEMDILGALLFAGILFCISYFLTILGHDPASIKSWKTWLFPIMSILFLVGFLYREDRVKNPVIDLDLLRTRVFAVTNILNLVYGGCSFGMATFIPYFAQVSYGLSKLASGSLLTGQALGMMVMGAISSMLLKRTGYRKPMALGFFIFAMSAFGMGFGPPVLFGWKIPGYWYLMFISIIGGLGSGINNPASNNAAIELLPEKISAISGLRGMFRQGGGMLGVSIIVLVLSRFTDLAKGFQVVFIGLGIILLLTIPLIREVPDGITDHS